MEISDLSECEGERKLCEKNGNEANLIFNIQFPFISISLVSPPRRVSEVKGKTIFRHYEYFFRHLFISPLCIRNHSHK